MYFKKIFFFFVQLWRLLIITKEKKTNGKHRMKQECYYIRQISVGDTHTAVNTNVYLIVKIVNDRKKNEKPDVVRREIDFGGVHTLAI